LLRFKAEKLIGYSVLGVFGLLALTGALFCVRMDGLAFIPALGILAPVVVSLAAVGAVVLVHMARAPSTRFAVRPCPPSILCLSAFVHTLPPPQETSVRITSIAQCLLYITAVVLVGLRVDFLVALSYRGAFAPAFAAAGLPLLQLVAGIIIGPRFNHETAAGFWIRHRGTGDGIVLLGFTLTMLVVICLPFTTELMLAMTLDGVAAYAPSVITVPIYLLLAPFVFFVMIRALAYGCSREV
jgi:hypothetical protein